MVSKAELALVKSLKDKRSRDENGVFAGEGEKFARELLASDIELITLYCRDGILAREFMHQADNPQKIILVSNKEMERLSQLKNPSDVVAIARVPVYDLNGVNPKQELILALDAVQDPGNLGTIIRIADWFGIKNVVCSLDTADCFNPKVVQATMGALLRVKVHYTSLEAFLGHAKSLIYGAFLDGENIYGSSLNNHGIIVMGNEGHGVSDEIKALVTKKLHIPAYPAEGSGSESLNVATATAIVCAEFRRRIL